MIEVDDLQIHVDSRAAFLRGVELNLTPREFDLLAVLSAEPTRIVKYDDLLDTLWVSSEALDEHSAIRAIANRLRRKIADERFVHAHRGIGIQLARPTYKEQT